MILDAKTSGVRGEFRRADGGQLVRFVRWYDDQTHEFEAFRYDPKIAKERGVPLRSILYRGRARLVFQERRDASRPTGRIAPSTPFAEIKREVLKDGEMQVPAQPLFWLPGMPIVECEEPLCHRRAEWAVAVEQIVEPERGPDGKLYERAVTIGSAVFCSWHYRAPRQFSLRGVEAELENIPVRPQ